MLPSIGAVAVAARSVNSSACLFMRFTFVVVSLKVLTVGRLAQSDCLDYTPSVMKNKVERAIKCKCCDE